MRSWVCIVGLGNPHRGDDGAGLVVVERLRAGALAKGGVRYFSRMELDEELLGPASKADLLIFVDASVNGSREIRWKELKPRPPLSPLTHQMGPETFLWLIQLLRGSAPKAFLVCVPALRFGLEESLSPDTLRLVREAEAQIKRFLGKQGERGLRKGGTTR